MCVLIFPSILTLNVLLPNKCLASYQLSLTALWNHRGKSGGWRHSFLTSALQGVEWLNSRAGRYGPGEDMVPISCWAGWALQPFRKFWRNDNYLFFYRNSNPIPYPVEMHAASLLFSMWTAASCFSTVSIQMQLSLHLEWQKNYENVT